MYNSDMKPLIKYAIELDISNIRTFEGYLGGSMISFTTDSQLVVSQIKKFCHRLEIDTNVKRKNGSFEIFCAFGKDRFKTNDHINDNSIYELKE